MVHQDIFKRIEPKQFWLELVDTVYGDGSDSIQSNAQEDENAFALKLQRRRRLRRMQSQNALQRVFSAAAEQLSRSAA